jgi:hypothetical protein
MRDEMFADPWLDARPRPGSAEPELGLRRAPRPPDPLSGTENAGRRGLSSPPDPVPSRAPMTSAALPVGSLLYLVLVGLVAAATIGVFFGAGFLLLVHPGKETVADTGTRDPPRPYSDAARADLEDPPAPRESAAPGSAAVAAPPGSPLAQPAAMAEAPAPQQSEAAENSPPGASSSHPPARTALEPEPASGSPGSSASAMPLASPGPILRGRRTGSWRHKEPADPRRTKSSQSNCISTLASAIWPERPDPNAATGGADRAVRSAPHGVNRAVWILDATAGTIVCRKLAKEIACRFRIAVAPRTVDFGDQRHGGAQRGCHADPRRGAELLS